MVNDADGTKKRKRKLAWQLISAEMAAQTLSCGLADKQTDGQTDRQTDIQTGRQRETGTGLLTG